MTRWSPRMAFSGAARLAKRGASASADKLVAGRLEAEALQQRMRIELLRAG